MGDFAEDNRRMRAEGYTGTFVHKEPEERKAPPRVQARWAIYDPRDILMYVARDDEKEADAWRVYLGWPGPDEITDAKKRGFRCLRVYVAVR
jgi:hypothetical protein